jgi:hypothetical protein
MWLKVTHPAVFLRARVPEKRGFKAHFLVST